MEGERGKQMLLSGSLNEEWCQEGCKIFRILLPTPTSFFHVTRSFWLEKRVKMDILLLVWEDSKAAASRGSQLETERHQWAQKYKRSPTACVQAALAPHLLKTLWKLETLINYFLWDKQKGYFPNGYLQGKGLLTVMHETVPIKTLIYYKIIRRNGIFLYCFRNSLSHVRGFAGPLDLSACVHS